MAAQAPSLAAPCPAGERTSPGALLLFHSSPPQSFGEVVLEPRGTVGTEPMDMAEKSKNGGVDRRDLKSLSLSPCYSRAWVASPTV